MAYVLICAVMYKMQTSEYFVYTYLYYIKMYELFAFLKTYFLENLQLSYRNELMCKAD